MLCHPALSHLSSVFPTVFPTVYALIFSVSVVFALTGSVQEWLLWQHSLQQDPRALLCHVCEGLLQDEAPGISFVLFVAHSVNDKSFSLVWGTMIGYVDFYISWWVWSIYIYTVYFFITNLKYVGFFNAISMWIIQRIHKLITCWAVSSCRNSGHCSRFSAYNASMLVGLHSWRLIRRRSAFNVFRSVVHGRVTEHLWWRSYLHLCAEPVLVMINEACGRIDANMSSIVCVMIHFVESDSHNLGWRECFMYR